MSRRVALQSGEARDEKRAVPEEVAIALTYDGSTQAVMMATPDNLEDFAVGFSLTEGIAVSRSEIEEFEVFEAETGLELRMRLAEPRGKALAERRRYLAGPVGCGLCGIDSLDEARRAVPKVASDITVSSDTVFDAVAAMHPAQTLNRETRAVHAAGYYSATGGLVALREDVGRHNALDKLAGALARSGTDFHDGVVVLTSRVSSDLVQKAAMMRAPVLVAVSVPTALAIEEAEKAGITIIAVARDDSFEIFTCPERITTREPAEHDV